MKAVRYHGPGIPFRMDEVPIPQPEAGEVRVRIEAAGVCHTELHFESGLLNLGVAPVTMGHEVVGVVEEVGEGVAERHPGDRVIVYYYAGCGRCEWCREGLENLCPALRAEFGFVSDGGYAEHIVVPARNAVPLPASLSPEEAAPIGCAVTTAVHACGLAQVGAGDTVVVYGVGAVGFGLIQVARHRDARVAGVGRSPAKLATARELGAEHTVNATKVPDVAAAIREWTDGRGADIVFELVATRDTMPRAVAALAPRGHLLFIGYSEDRLDLHPIELVVREARVSGSVGNTLAELEESVRLVAGGEVRTVVDRVLPLERWEEGLAAVRRGETSGRVVLRPE